MFVKPHAIGSTYGKWHLLLKFRDFHFKGNDTRKNSAGIVRVRWNFFSFAENFSEISTFLANWCRCVRICISPSFRWSFAKVESVGSRHKRTIGGSSNRESWVDSVRLLWLSKMGRSVRAFDYSVCECTCVVDFQSQIPDWFCQRYMLSLKIKPCMSSSSKEKLRTAH